VSVEKLSDELWVGVKEYLKTCDSKRSAPLYGVTACLLHNEPTSCAVRRG